MRLLVPRRGRGGSLRSLTRRPAVAAAAVLVAAVVILVVALTGGDSEPEHPAGPVASPTPTATATPAPTDLANSLELGITEPNPAFLTGGGGGGRGEFQRWRDALPRIGPHYYRLVIDWANIAAPDGSGIDLVKPQSGCMRDKGPCAGWGGVRAQLEALAAAQKAQPGRLRGMVVFTGTPEGIAAPGFGCERSDVIARSRPPGGTHLDAYQAVIRAVLEEVRRSGADVPYWSPWNEPNHPYFLSPQHYRCNDLRTTAAVKPYALMAASMLSVLDQAPGDQHLVLGETAGLFERKSTTTTVPQFIRRLPRDLVCRADVYGEHGYLGNDDPVEPVVRALRRFDCPGGVPPVWITETGIKSPTEAACRAVHRKLVRWYRDPRVQAVFQYTLREDDLFPTGLISTDLSRAFPVLKEWQAWGSRDGARAAPPGVSC